MSDWNKDVIEEFRANQGRVGGFFEGKPLLLLHHTGARTGTERVSPLMYQAIDSGYVIFASKGGADTNPDWFHNLKAHPDTWVEVGSEVVDVRSRILDGAEHDTIWTQWKSDWPFFAEYEQKTARQTIPVIALDRV